MSNKLYSMLELSSLGFPHNKFYALDMNGVEPEEAEAYLQDGLRTFKSRVNCQSMIVRTGLAGKPEVKLFIAPDLDASDNELITSKLKEALAFFSQRFNGYGDAFLILQEWTSQEDYTYSLNLLKLKDHYIIEAVKGNHYNLDRDEHPPTVIKLSTKGESIIKPGLNPNDLMVLNRKLRQLFNNYFFQDNCVYEFSLLKNRPSFYQIKKPGKLYKEPISKKEFYKKLRDNNIPFSKKIKRINF